MSKTANITEDDRWFQGEDKTFTFDIVDADDVPLDVSSYELSYQLEELHDSDVDLILKTNPEITVGAGAAAADRVSVPIAAADSASLDPRVYKHTLWRTDSGVQQVLAEGTALLQRGAAPGGGS